MLQSIQGKLITKFIGALFAGALLYLAFDDRSLIWLSVVSLLTLMYFIDKTPKAIYRCLILSAFILCFVFLQFSFLFGTASMVGSFVLLLNVLISLLLLIPLYGLSFIRSKYYLEISLVGLLISEYIFATLPIGNQLFQLGVILCDIPIIIQWYKFTGIFFGSFWIMLISYSLYQVLFKGKSFRVLLGIILIPIAVSLILRFSINPHGNLRTIKLTSLAANKDADSMINALVSNDPGKVDYILVPEGALVFNEKAVKFSPALTQIKRYVNKYDYLCIILGISTYSTESMDNSVMIYSKDRVNQRFKVLKIPFCEYLPYPSILGKVDFIKNHVWYQMEEKANTAELYLHHQDTIAPLICYESLSTKYICDLVRQGANIFFVSSSNTFIDSKHIEHINMNILRANAIISERSFVRCVEHGISSIITPHGNSALETAYESKFTIESAKLYYKKTFFVKHYNIINRMYVMMLLCLLTVLVFLDKFRPKIYKHG